MSDLDERPATPPAPPGDAPAGRRRRLAPVLALVVAAVVAMLVVVLAGGDAGLNRQADSRLLGRPAPTLESARLDGTPFDLGQRRGRWVLVNFFAPWCGPCRQEHPELITFSQRHMTVGDAEVVSVVFDDLEGSREYFAEHGGEWAVVSDPTGAIALDWGVAMVPESFLVDPNGFVVSKLINGVTADGLDALLARAQAAALVPGAP